MRTSRLLLAALVAGVSVAVPASTVRAMPHVAAAITAPARVASVYRITITGERGTSSQRIDIILEDGVNGTVGYLVNDSSSSMLDDLRIEDGTLHATVVTSRGRGALTVKLFGEELRGTLTIGTVVLGVQGVRAL